MLFTAETKYLPIVSSAAAKYNVPAPLILAHMRQESSFDPYAYRAEPSIGDASYGLLQILLGTARTMDSGATANRLLDPNYNVDLGTQYMAKNLIRYGGDIKSAIAAYNAGTARVNEKGEFVNSQGKTNVQDYVDKVLRNYRMYTEWLGKGARPFDVSVFDISTVSPYLIGAFVIMTLIVLMRVKKTEVEYV